MHKIKVLSNGPFPVGNRKKGMGSTISMDNKEREPRGSDASKIVGNTAGKFQTRKYNQMRKSVFGLGK